MKLLCSSLIVLGLITGQANAAEHACAEDAMSRAGSLLKLHYGAGDNALNDKPGASSSEAGQDRQAWELNSKVTTLKPIKALVGKGRFDVLEVTGFVYKAEYRMRFVYAQIKDTCALMGQEILEASNPY
jgi:hypothetical protein